MIRDMGPSLLLPIAAIAASFAAAALGLRAATVQVRDNLDKFMSDLQRQGRWASWAAFAAAVSVVLQSVDRLLQ